MGSLGAGPMAPSVASLLRERRRRRAVPEPSWARCRRWVEEGGEDSGEAGGEWGPVAWRVLIARGDGGWERREATSPQGQGRGR